MMLPWRPLARQFTRQLKRMEVGQLEKLKKDTLVAHVVGSSSDKRNHLGRYKKAVGKPELAPRCAKRMCSKPACLGGHVWIKGRNSNDICYIVPLCSSCNNSKSENFNGRASDWFPVKANTQERFTRFFESKSTNFYCYDSQFFTLKTSPTNWSIYFEILNMDTLLESCFRLSSRKWFQECSKTIFSSNDEIAKLPRQTLSTLSSTLLENTSLQTFNHF
jgi:hypothetical protein